MTQNQESPSIEPDNKPRRLLTLCLWIAIAGALIVASRPLWQPSLADILSRSRTTADRDTTAPIDPVSARLSSLEDTLAILTEAVNNNKPAPPIDTSLSDQMDSLTDTVAVLEKSIKSMDEKIKTAPPQQPDTQQPHTPPDTFTQPRERELLGLILAQQLNRKIFLSRSISKEINLLTSYTDKDLVTHISTLKELEAVGIPALNYLKTSFQKYIPLMLKADAKPEDGFWGKLLGQMQSIVTIRRIGEDVEGTDTDAVVARAEAHLMNDKLDDAFAELAGLPAPAATILKPWREEAEKRLKAEKSAEAILDYFTTRLISRDTAHDLPQAADETGVQGTP